MVKCRSALSRCYWGQEGSQFYWLFKCLSLQTGSNKGLLVCYVKGVLEERTAGWKRDCTLTRPPFLIYCLHSSMLDFKGEHHVCCQHLSGYNTDENRRMTFAAGRFCIDKTMQVFQSFLFYFNARFVHIVHAFLCLCRCPKADSIKVMNIKNSPHWWAALTTAPLQETLECSRFDSTISHLPTAAVQWWGSFTSPPLGPPESSGFGTTSDLQFPNWVASERTSSIRKKKTENTVRSTAVDPGDERTGCKWFFLNA